MSAYNETELIESLINFLYCKLQHKQTQKVKLKIKPIIFKSYL